MSKLVWTPQPAFSDFFYTSPKDIVKNRSVFRQELEYHVPYGGRGSAKTWTFADACVVEGSLRPVRILVTREMQNSIEESIKSEIEAAIHARGLAHFYKIQVQDITAPNGTKFIFKGLKNNINSLKSIADVDIVLAEESENISANSWNKFLPSIRPRSGRAPIIIVIFNPDDELDDTYQRFIVTPPPHCASKLINWRDNKYFPPHLETQRLHCKRTMPRKVYNNIWEGEPKGSDDNVIIDRAWVRAARFASRLPGFEQVGESIVTYDPAGQGRDENAVLGASGNIVRLVDEWLKSPDLREATKRAMGMARDIRAAVFRYDECGGYGDGVSVFVSDVISEWKAEYERARQAILNAAAEDMPHRLQRLVRDWDFRNMKVVPFNAGDTVVDPDEIIEGTEKTNDEMYANLKAQAHGVTAQKLYNTYRFVELGESVDSADMISIDIADDDVFNKLTRELSSPIWVKSGVNSKKKVESKKDMEKRTDQPSPNMADAFHMIPAPTQPQHEGFFDVFLAN